MQIHVERRNRHNTTSFIDWMIVCSMSIDRNARVCASGLCKRVQRTHTITSIAFLVTRVIVCHVILKAINQKMLQRFSFRFPRNECDLTSSSKASKAGPTGRNSYMHTYKSKSVNVAIKYDATFNKKEVNSAFNVA